MSEAAWLCKHTNIHKHASTHFLLPPFVPFFIFSFIFFSLSKRVNYTGQYFYLFFSPPRRENLVPPFCLFIPMAMGSKRVPGNRSFRHTTGNNVHRSARQTQKTAKYIVSICKIKKKKNKKIYIQRRKDKQTKGQS